MNNSKELPRAGPHFAAPPMWGAVGDPVEPLPADERAALAAHATVVRCRKGESIFNAGEPASDVFSIASGVVKLYRMRPGEGEHIARFMFPGDLMGLAEHGRYVNSAKSITAAILYRMPVRALEPRLRDSPGLEFRVITKLCHDLRRTQDHALLMSKRRASAKIGLFVQMIEADHGGSAAEDAELYLPMSRDDIAAYLGISPEAVSRGFRGLVACGAVSFRDRHHLTIADRARLEAVTAGPSRRHRSSSPARQR